MCKICVKRVMFDIPVTQMLLHILVKPGLYTQMLGWGLRKVICLAMSCWGSYVEHFEEVSWINVHCIKALFNLISFTHLNAGGPVCHPCSPACQ